MASSGSAGDERAAVQQQQQAEKKKMRVMVAVDESEGSFYALKWVLKHLFSWPLATAAAGGDQINQEEEELGTVIVVDVQHPFHPYFIAGPALESAKRAQEQHAAAISSRALNMCQEKRVKAEVVILEGEPKEMICEAAEKMQVDLLVVGSRGLGKIKRAFLGSVSDYCAHQAKCPILIVRLPPESHSS